MKRFVAAFVVLALVLGGVLAWRLWLQAEAANRPPGSSGVVEFERVVVAARIASRVVAVGVEEGDRVEAGQLLAELDCAEMDALAAQAEAQLATATAQLEPLRRQAEAAAAQARAVGSQAEAAAAQAEAVRSQADAATAQASAARGQIGSVRAQRENVERQRDRVSTLREAEVATAVDLEGLETTAEDLRYRLGAASDAARAAQASAAAVGGQSRAAESQANAATHQALAAQSQASAAQEAIRVGESQRDGARAAVDRARVGQAECRIVAPRAGIVSIRARNPGEVVLPGTTIVELLDPSDTRVSFYVTNADVRHVAPGVRVRATADTYGDRPFAGAVLRVAQEAEFTPRTVQTRDDRDRLVFEVEARLENPDGALRAGMPVEVVVEDVAR